MIANLRGIARVVTLVVFLAVWSACFGIARPFARGPHRERWRRRFFGGATRTLLRIFGADLHIEGSFPTEPGVLVTNHHGYMDILVLASLGPTVFVSRDDIQHWPLIGPLTQWAGTIFIDRGQKGQLPGVIEQMKIALAEGNQVVFFPEGTSGSGAELKRFRPSLFAAAVGAEAPVHCATLHYQTNERDVPASLSVAWWGDMDFSPHAWQLACLRGVKVGVTFAETSIQSSDRKFIAAEAEAAIRASFRPLEGALPTDGDGA